MANNLVQDFTRLLSLQKIPFHHVEKFRVSDFGFTVRFPERGEVLSSFKTQWFGLHQGDVRNSAGVSCEWKTGGLGWGNFGTIKDMKHGEFEYILELNFLE